ncbi:low-density lipoprotein receptor-related protein 1-like [Patiria miniata]|uniref:Uncharacterized protein n=1 Tax=Patiria miniata TaxID=46514 RepID=A0A914ASW4_PATMI|nr:low-density lipoprotein receptor-related protein 1-like [Patiria miniata]
MQTLVREMTLRILVVATLMGACFKQVDAGDFMLVAASDNYTIFAGSMSKQLADLAALPLEGVEKPQALDYDPTENMVYWTQYHPDTGIGKLSRAHLNGTNQMILLSDIRVAFGLALDLVARMAYWTDNTLGQIGRVPMDGSGPKEIIIESLSRPRGIVTDHDQGHIYWTDVGDDTGVPKIERANSDGTNRVTLVADNLVWPQAVILDHETNHLYWCDGVLDTIERSDLLGNNRELLINLTQYAPIHPFDMVIYKDYIYWSDLVYSGVIRVHLNGRGEQNFGPTSFHEIRRIHIQKEPNYCDSSPCLNGATCEDIVNGFVCHCPSGFSGVTCFENPCSSLPCMNGGTCSSSSAGFTCRCPPHYEGPTCALDPCSSLPCVNGGTCSSSSAGFTCQCPPHYEGPTCALDPCSSLPCVNGGTCSSSSAGFTCRCPPHYEGPTCALFVGCNAPFLPNHVRLLKNVTVFAPGEEATFTCDRGYSIKGSSSHNVSRACLADGTWSGGSVQCYQAEQSDPEERTIPVVPITAGGGAAVFIIVLLIIVIIALKMKKKRNNQERVVNVPPISYCRSPPPAYQVDSDYLQSDFQANASGNNNPCYMADGAVNINMKQPLPTSIYEEVLN